MHQSCFDFASDAAFAIGPRKHVVEFGGRNVNGGVRDLFETDSYVALDALDGPGVDVVADASTWTPTIAPDTILCFSVLEHAHDPGGIVANASQILSPDGILVLTCPCDPWPVHSGIDGGSTLHAGEVYRNLTLAEVEGWLREGFGSWWISRDVEGTIFALARKDGEPVQSPLPRERDATDALVSMFQGVGIEYTRDAARGVVDAARRTRAVIRIATPAGKVEQWVRSLVSSTTLVVLSRDDARFERFSASVARLVPAPEVIRVSDARSACEGYARGLGLVQTPSVVFVHDDVEFLTPDAVARIEQHLLERDVIGVAGTDVLLDGRWTTAGPFYCFGQVAGPSVREGQAARVAVFGPRQGVNEAVGLDGVLIAARTSVARAVGFDAETFDGWHHYDVDFSFRAHLAGARVAVVQDVPIFHGGEGHYEDEAWIRSEQVFQGKHAGSLPSRPGIRPWRGNSYAVVDTPDPVHFMREVSVLRPWFDAFSEERSMSDVAVAEVKKVRLDVACGANCVPGFEGLDIAPLPGVKHVHNVLSFPWPFADESVDEVWCSHFIEHLPMLLWTPGYANWQDALSPFQKTDRSVDLFLKFFDEVHRILKPGGKATFVCPQAKNDRAFQDPTHRRFIVPASFFYLDARWRKLNGLEHAAYGVSCDFPMDGPEGAKIEPTWNPEQRTKIEGLHRDAILADMKHYWNYTEDLRADLVKPPIPRNLGSAG